MLTDGPRLKAGGGRWAVPAVWEQRTGGVDEEVGFIGRGVVAERVLLALDGRWQVADAQRHLPLKRRRLVQLRQAAEGSLPLQQVRRRVRTLDGEWIHHRLHRHRLCRSQSKINPIVHSNLIEHQHQSISAGLWVKNPFSTLQRRQYSRILQTGSPQESLQRIPSPAREGGRNYQGWKHALWARLDYRPGVCNPAGRGCVPSAAPAGSSRSAWRWNWTCQSSSSRCTPCRVSASAPDTRRRRNPPRDSVAPPTTATTTTTNQIKSYTNRINTSVPSPLPLPYLRSKGNAIDASSWPSHWCDSTKRRVRSRIIPLIAAILNNPGRPWSPERERGRTWINSVAARRANAIRQGFHSRIRNDPELSAKDSARIPKNP